MKVPYSWLKEFVPITAAADEVGRRLTMLGLEVEIIEEISDDFVLDVQPTSNRGDCLSILGIARETAAAFDLPLSWQPPAVVEEGEPVETLATVEIAAPDLCPRYCARVMVDVEVKTSPPWVIHRLLRCGMRPINNVVDATNYVMLELGQPLHAFDYDLITPGADGRAAIIVRTACDGEPLTTLDGTERRLREGMLVIADPQRAIALAGVMGGGNTEVSWTTTRVLLESAHFDRVGTRRTSKALELSSEASYRFERIVDPNGTVAAINRVAEIIAQSSGKVAPGIIDAYPKAMLPVTIELRPQRANRLLGTRLPKERMAEVLRRLNLEVEEGDVLRVTCPTYRPDLQAEIDLVEEVARVHGYDNLPATSDATVTAPGRQAPELQFDLKVKQALMACGLNETMSYTLTDAGVFDRLNLPPQHPLRRALRVKNPKSEEYVLLRTTMLDSMFAALAHNARRGVADVQLFEVGRVYLPHDDDNLPHERRSVAIAVCGSAWNSRWGLDQASTRTDFYALKGIIEELIAALCDGTPQFAPLAHPALSEGDAAAISLDGEAVGFFGAPATAVRERYDLPDGALVAELDLEALLRHARAPVQTMRLSRYPAVRRDVALIVAGGVSAGEIEQIIRRQGGENLEQLDLFDVYSGKQIPAGYKSIAYSLAFRHAERTLTDEEVEGALAKIKDALRTQLDAQMRE